MREHACWGPGIRGRSGRWIASRSAGVPWTTGGERETETEERRPSRPPPAEGHPKTGSSRFPVTPPLGAEDVHAATAEATPGPAPDPGDRHRSGRDGERPGGGLHGGGTPDHGVEQNRCAGGAARRRGRRPSGDGGGGRRGESAGGH